MSSDADEHDRTPGPEQRTTPTPLSRRRFVQTSAGVGASALGLGGAGVTGAQSAGTDYNLAEALQKSLYFFDANMCGDDVSEASQLEWRGDCHTHDLAVPLDEGPDQSGTNLSQGFIDEHRDVLDPDGTGTVDVSGGYHDAGDHVKFGMPEGYAASTVAWAVHEFEDAFREVGSYDHVLHHLRRFADYFVGNTFRNDDGEVVTFCHQVSKGGDGYDHAYWGPAELQRANEHGARPAYFATPQEPASDECAAAAAALAAIADVFQGEDDDAAAEYLDHAEALYEFALEHRGLGQYGAPHYDSNGDEDDLAWASLWLHVASGEDRFLEDCLGEDSSGNFSGHVSSFVDSKDDQWSFTWVHSWDDVRGGLITKLAAVTDDEFWWDLTRWHHTYWTGGDVDHQGGSGEYITTTPAGFSWLDQWGSARYNAAAQFTALVYHEHRDTDTSAAIAEWALGQMEYIMGDSPIDYSLIVGFTDDHAERPHHDTAHGATTGTPTEPEEHRHTLWGALVGGPDQSDSHTDETDDYILNEVAIDFNAGLVGALAGHYTFFGGDGEPVEPFPPEPDGEDRLAVDAELSGVDSARVDVSAYLDVELFYPARYAEDLSMRYFFELGEGVSPSEIEVDVTYDQVGSEVGQDVEILGPEPYDGEDGVYYVEFSYDGAELHGEYELSFALAAYGVDGWDPSTGHSVEGIPDTLGEAETLPLYQDGQQVFGVEPDGSRPVDPEPPRSPDDQWTNEVTETTIELEWESVEDATEYHVYLDGTQEATTASTTYEFTDLEPGTAYAIGVASANDEGSSDVVETTVETAVEAACEGAAGGSMDVEGRTVCDLNDDGAYRDVTGDGDLGQDDVVAFFENQHRSAWKQDAFDYSGNGEVNQFDVVELFDYVLVG